MKITKTANELWLDLIDADVISGALDWMELKDLPEYKLKNFLLAVDKALKAEEE